MYLNERYLLLTNSLTMNTSAPNVCSQSGALYINSPAAKRMFCHAVSETVMLISSKIEYHSIIL